MQPTGNNLFCRRHNTLLIRLRQVCVDPHPSDHSINAARSALGRWWQISIDSCRYTAPEAVNGYPPELSSKLAAFD